MSEQDEYREDRDEFSTRTQEFILRLFRDPRYLLIGKMERFGRELLAFVEGCTLLSPTGDVRGQTLLNSEFEMTGRPDGEKPYGKESLVEHYLSRRAEDDKPLDEEDLQALRDESWQYYVRRNFAFQMKEFTKARDDAEHNLAIWNLVEQAEASEEIKWSFLRWWPWIERDRAIAQALLHVREERLEEAATELYRAQRAIAQFGDRYAEYYSKEEEEGSSLYAQMGQHITTLVDILREDANMPVSLEENLEKAMAQGDDDEVERLRREMIRRAVGESEKY